jgi:hypothetical protein
MSPLFPRRRSRRRSVSGRLVLLLALAALTALIVGGLTQVSSQSHSYDVSLNRSLGAQGSVVADESNATGSQVIHLMANLLTEDRQTLQAQLDDLVQQTATQASMADRATSGGTLGAEFNAVFDDRAQAVSQVRAAIDGLLGMHPLAVAGALQNTGSGASTPTLLTSDQATTRIAAAGTLLTRSDRVYAGVRHALSTSVGRAKLPASVWLRNPQLWQVGAVATTVDLVASSTSLAASHELVLRTVRLDPQALPSVAGTPTGTSVLSPTDSVSLTAVLSDVGSVDEPHASVQFSLAPQVSGSTVSRLIRVAVTAGQSVTLPTVTFKVKPGHSYQFTVSVVLPAAQISVSGTSVTQVLEIAPGT